MANQKRVLQQQYEAARLRLLDEVKQAYYELYYVRRAGGVATDNVELLKAEQIKGVLKNDPNSATVFAERVTGGYYVDFNNTCSRRAKRRSSSYR